MLHLKVGDKAPEFIGVDQYNHAISSAEFIGNKLVLFFYPKANTPGCTLEAQNLRDNYQTFIEKGFKVVGVSADAVSKQKSFCEKHNLPFPLIADESKEIINSYGVWGPKKFMGREFDGINRTTFIIDENGIISDIISKVDTKKHAFQILKIN